MSYELKTPPIIKKSTMPFDYSIEGFNHWLTTLNIVDSSHCCQQILCVLRELHLLEINDEEREQVLDSISERLTAIDKNLETKNLEKTPLSIQSFTEIELIIWTYTELANSYHLQLAQSIEQKKQTATKENQAVILYKALLAISQAYLKIAGIYVLPYKNFWSSLYQLYYLGEENNLLKVNLLVEDTEKTNCYRLIKKILLLELCDTNQFKTKEIHKIFLYLENLVDYAKIIQKPPSVKNLHGIRIFTRQQDSLPAMIKKDYQPTLSTRYLVFPRVVKQAFLQLEDKTHSNSLSIISKAALIRAFKTLSSTQKSQHTRLTKPPFVSGIIGLENIIQFYKGNNHSQAEKEKQLSFEHFKVINSSLNGYKLLWNDDFLWSNTQPNIQIGSVFGVMNTDIQNIEVGIIRRIDISENGVSLGIELLTLTESQAVCIISQKDSKETQEWGLLLNNNSLLFAESHFYSKDDMYLQMGKDKVLFRLEKQLNSTAAINYFQISFLES